MFMRQEVAKLGNQIDRDDDHISVLKSERSSLLEEKKGLEKEVERLRQTNLALENDREVAYDAN
jgi:hypothetical protein